MCITGNTRILDYVRYGYSNGNVHSGWANSFYSPLFSTLGYTYDVKVPGTLFFLRSTQIPHLEWISDRVFPIHPEDLISTQRHVFFFVHNEPVSSLNRIVNRIRSIIVKTTIILNAADHKNVHSVMTTASICHCSYYLLIVRWIWCHALGKFGSILEETGGWLFLITFLNSFSLCYCRKHLPQLRTCEKLSLGNLAIE